jgi:Na+/H+-dicarboxylate symporter
MKKLSLNVWILIGALIGLSLGFWITHVGPDAPGVAGTLYTSKLVSTFFLDLLRMIVVPLVFASIVVGVANLQAHNSMHRVWVTTLVFFMMTTGIAILIGFGASSLFKPGEGAEVLMLSEAVQNAPARNMALSDYISHLLRGMIQNPFKALAQGDILAILIAALLIGIALVAGGERYKTIHNVFKELQDICLRIVGWIMWIAPIGVGALLLRLVATQNNSVYQGLLELIVVVIGATLFHGVIVLPLILYLTTRVNPLRFWRGAKPALITAFATSSSNATLPVTLRAAKEDLGVKEEVADFVIPLGATINMDGTALYEAVAVLFVARLAGVDLSVAEQIIVFFVAMLGAIGAPGMPSVGMLSVVLVLESVGLPTAAIALLLPIDRLLDTVRTAVNVEGDMVGSIVVQKLT